MERRAQDAAAGTREPGAKDGDSGHDRSDASAPHGAAEGGVGAARLLLERIEPTLGRGERLVLDPREGLLRVGRAEENEIRLFTGSASRRHALIELDAAGEWQISPLEGRTLRVDGEEVATPVVLEPGLNLVMGGDHLRCALAEPSPSEATKRACAKPDDVGNVGIVGEGIAGEAQRRSSPPTDRRRTALRLGLPVTLVGLIVLAVALFVWLAT